MGCGAGVVHPEEYGEGNKNDTLGKIKLKSEGDKEENVSGRSQEGNK